MQILRTYRTYVGELLSRKPGNASKSVVLLCQIHTGSKRYGLAMRWPLWRIATRIRYSDLMIMRAISRNASPSKMQEGRARRRHLRPLLAYINTASSSHIAASTTRHFACRLFIYCATKSISHPPSTDCIPQPTSCNLIPFSH